MTEQKQTTQGKERVRRVLFDIGEDQEINSATALPYICSENATRQYGNNIVIPVFRRWLPKSRRELLRVEDIEAYIAVLSPFKWGSSSYQESDRAFEEASNYRIPTAVYTLGDPNEYDKAFRNSQEYIICLNREIADLKSGGENTYPKSQELQRRDWESKSLQVGREFLEKQVKRGAALISGGEGFHSPSVAMPLISDWLKQTFK